MSASCMICALPAPTGLAMLQTCLHCFHTACLRQYVQMYGRCPQPECAKPAGEADIRILIFDPPQSNGTDQAQQQDATATRVWEVLNATLDRLKSFSTGSDQERAQVAQVGEAFELILREKSAQKGKKSANEGGSSGFGQPNANDNGNGGALAEMESGWDKLMRIVKSKEVKMVVLAVVVALICVFFWSIVGPGSLLATELGEMLGGFLAVLRGIAPEILAGLLAAGSVLFGLFKSKKITE